MKELEKSVATVTLGDILEEFDERLGPRSEPEILTLTEKQGFVVQRERFNKRLAAEDTSDYKFISLHDVAFNPYLLWAGAIAQNTAWESAIISPVYPTFHVRSGYDPRFVDYILNGDALRARYDAISVGSVPRRRRATVAGFLGLTVPRLPPLSEQRRLAEILDKAAALPAQRQEVLGQLDTLAQSVFLEMFGDPATNPKAWPSMRFAETLSIPLRNGLSPSHTGEVVGKVLTLAAITGSDFDASAWKASTFLSAPPPDQAVDESDFLICRGNGNLRLVGKGHFPSSTMNDVTFPDTMIAARISAKRIERAFLQYVWHSNAVRRQIESLARTTNGTYKVNQTMLEGIAIIAPPLTLQREFGRRASAIHRLKSAQRAALSEADSLFGSIQHQAFRGSL